MIAVVNLGGAGAGNAAQWRIYVEQRDRRNWERNRSCVIIHYYSPKTTPPPLTFSFSLVSILFRHLSSIFLRPQSLVIEIASYNFPSTNFDYSFYNFSFFFCSTKIFKSDSRRGNEKNSIPLLVFFL